MPAYCGEAYSHAASRPDITINGLMIALYRPGAEPGMLDLEVGIQVQAPFAASGRVVASALPACRAATTAHYGDYARLGEAYRALAEWCKAEGLSTTSLHWELYGHWSDDPAKVRTDVLFQLAP